MRIILWGATGQAKVLRELLRDDEILAVFDNSPDVPPPWADVPLFRGEHGFLEWLSAQHGELPRGLVAIGGDRGRDRVEIQHFLSGHGIAPHIAIHRTAFVADDARVGAGSQILAQAAVCAGARLGEACIVNTSSSIDHECVLGDGVHICPGAHVAGCVEIGADVMIGTGASVLPRLTIGDGAIVGAGAVVRDHVPPRTIVAGNPARIIRARD